MSEVLTVPDGARSVRSASIYLPCIRNLAERLLGESAEWVMGRHMKASSDSSAILIATRKKRLVSRWSRFLQRIAAVHVLRQSALIKAEVVQRRPHFLFLDL